ncbi:FAD-binding protein [Brevibacterium sp. 91QC2O2]|uniref:FAD-binding oxidoreductase n=1 Tax=Brevibacterium TaxID=1696 RepID=UPI00211BC71E|nr:MULTISPECIES: FAD-linked oxidase C-terminal domain-containing protein [unclassified Brevibacterium]MCQ9367916.1 FAD-binding protein [Brevibacterium sp. 91QC2O2]MCQ9386368.1 FAD-binding protein [Brevibacterium sp. 68QC2CO]
MELVDLTQPEQQGLTPAATPVDLGPLRAALSSEHALVTDADVVASYSIDHAMFCPFGTARGLVRAETIEDVQATVRFAAANRIPIVPQGARTGLAGAANAVDGSLLLSLHKMDRLLDVNPVESTCTVQPGIINKDLKDQLAPHGLAYPPDPGSVAISTIGGNVSTNAGGMCCVKYGVTRQYVRSLKVVLADGTLTTVGRHTKKDVAGLELSQLFIGAEGTLGVVVEITLDLVPLLPAPLTAMVLFDDQVAAVGTVTDFLAAGNKPNLMEFMDGKTVAMVNDYQDFGLPDGIAGMLLVQSDGDGSLERAKDELARLEEVAKANGALDVMYSDDPADSDMLVAARRAVSPATEKYVNNHGGGSLVDDVCIPRGKMREFFAALLELDARFTDAEVTTCAHVGDGNMHPTVLFDASDATSTEHARELFAAIMQLGLDLGGTVTGEHGVGYLKAKWLGEELDPASKHIHAVIKHGLDPLGIMNPGKMLYPFVNEPVKISEDA